MTAKMSKITCWIWRLGNNISIFSYKEHNHNQTQLQPNCVSHAFNANANSNAVEDTHLHEVMVLLGKYLSTMRLIFEF